MAQPFKMRQITESKDCLWSEIKLTFTTWDDGSLLDGWRLFKTVEKGETKSQFWSCELDENFNSSKTTLKRRLPVGIYSPQKFFPQLHIVKGLANFVPVGLKVGQTIKCYIKRPRFPYNRQLYNIRIFQRSTEDLFIPRCNHQRPFQGDHLLKWFDLSADLRRDR